MTDLRKAAEQALKYFEDAHGLEDTEVEIKEALRQALAKPEMKELTAHDRYQERQRIAEEQRVALAQPQREWVGLDGEIPGLGLVTDEFYNGMIVAEDILRKKNT